MKKSFAYLASLISASFAAKDTVANNVIEDQSIKMLDDDHIIISKLNHSVSNLLAAHRSHRSHSSHSSHRSSAGGGYSTPRTYTPPSTYTPPAKKADPLGQTARPKSSYPSVIKESDLVKSLTDKDKRKNIIMRMQLALQFEGLYSGTIDGVMGERTRNAVKAYKKQNGVTSDGVMDAETLNALGIKGF